MEPQPPSAKAVFDHALEIESVAERASYLDQACAADPPLRQKVEALLAAYQQAGSFLEAGPAGGAGTLDQPVTEPLGTVIGPYKLLQQIGEGGMGTVFMAEQTNPVQRKVALKVIKAGLDSRQVIARFEAERQALAMMDHVNIARVFDGGTTEAGRPYFVMELVHGVPITKYCDDNRLTPRERLELFVPACQAIQHAHQKGIIHRDVKPSNVMVTLYDGKPVPKVIDFGVAKATEQKLTERTLFTQYGAMVGTLEYMSPEQAELSALGADTRSDIFSLGVLLYELLTGNTPLTHKRMKDAAYAEILRMIKEEEPPKPSTRLSDSGEALASISAQRHTEPAKLAKLMRGELDWIVMRALEKDRNRRYETANGFAADVKRYLNDEPVQACPPSAWYRLRKLVRRNKGPVLAASVVMLALVVGIIGTTGGLIRAMMAEADAARNERQAKGAQKEAQENLEDALAAVDQLLTRLADDRLADVPQMEPIRRDLLQDALKFYQKFLARKSDDPLIRREAARFYQRIGTIYNTLGQDADANEAYLKAIAMKEELGAASSRDPGERSELVNTRIEYSWLVGNNSWKGDECVRQLRRAVEVAESMVADFPDSPYSRVSWLWARNTLGAALIGRQPDEAEKILRENLRWAESDWSLSQIHTNLGFLCSSTQRLPEAVKHFRLNLEMVEKIVAATPSAPRPQRELGHALCHLAGVLAADQQQAEAADYQRRAILIFDKLGSDFPAGPIYRHDLATAQVEHAALLKQLGQMAEAEKAYRRAADVFEKLAADFPTMPAFRQSAFDQRIHLSLLLVQGGRPLEAHEALGKATTMSAKLADDFAGRLVHKRGLVLIHVALARLLKAGGKTLEAQTAFDQAVAIQQALENDFADKPEFRRELANAHLLAADMLREDGRAEEAERFYHLAEVHWRQLVAGAPDDVEGLRGLALNYHNLGRLLDAQPRKRDAEEAFAHAVETWTKFLALSPADAFAREIKGHGHRHLTGYVGTTPEEVEHCRAAIQLFGALHAEFPDNTVYWSFLASTHQWLGRALGKGNKPQEAERAFRRAIELYEGLAAKIPNSPDIQGELSLAYFDLGYQLAAGGRANAAEELFHQAVASFSKGIELNPKVWEAWNSRGEACAQLKEWDKAGADFAKSVELVAQQPLPHYRHALARLALADTKHYRDVCADIVTRFGTSSDPNAVFWTVWTCVLAPDAVADWRPVVQLAEKAVADDPKNCDKLQGLGAVLYRAGRYQEAAKQLAEAEAAFPETQSPRTSPDYTGLFQAMTLHRLSRSDEAQQQLRRAVNDIDQPSEQTKIANAAWNRRLTLRLLRQEAEDLLKQGSGAKDQEPERKPD
jgi:eukaryotic-like serine/threonine-protein kinase